MSSATVKSAVLLLTGLGMGLLLSNLTRAVAVMDPGSSELSHKQFYLFVNEVRQNFVFGDTFAGHYTGSFTLSDGSVRNIELTPMLHNGMKVVEFKDTGGLTYMGLNGTTTNGTLMVQLIDIDTLKAELKADGWPLRGLRHGDGQP
jgi:hypothetical protein